MSDKSVFADVRKMYLKFGLIAGNELPQIPETIQVRLDHLTEELDETVLAVKENKLDDVIDGLIDLMVIAAGTLEMCGVDGQKHWDEVHRANSAKERGVHPKRGHSVDLIKPEGWVGPDHYAVLSTYAKGEAK